MPGRIEVYAWSRAGVRDLGIITPMAWANASQDAEAQAQRAAAVLKQTAPGLRALHLFHAGRSGGLGDPITGGEKAERIIAGPAITTAHRRYYAELFGRIHDSGARFDRLVLDYESGMGLWHLKGREEKLRVMRLVLGDPRSRGRVPEEVLAAAPEVLVDSVRSRDLYIAFNAWAAREVAAGLRSLVIEPARAVFGDGIAVSNYGDFDPAFATTDRNGWPHAPVMSGNEQAPVFYAIGRGNKYKQYEKHPRWNAFLDHMTLMRACLGRAPMTPWISRPGYSAFGEYNATSYLWTAMVLHLLHAGLRTFLLWNPAEEAGATRDTAKMDEAFESLTETFLFKEAAEVPREAVPLDADEVTTGPLTTTYEDFLEHEVLDGRPAVWE